MRWTLPQLFGQPPHKKLVIFFIGYNEAARPLKASSSSLRGRAEALQTISRAQEKFHRYHQREWTDRSSSSSSIWYEREAAFFILVLAQLQPLEATPASAEVGGRPLPKTLENWGHYNFRPFSEADTLAVEETIGKRKQKSFSLSKTTSTLELQRLLFRCTVCDCLQFSSNLTSRQFENFTATMHNM